MDTMFKIIIGVGAAILILWFTLEAWNLITSLREKKFYVWTKELFQKSQNNK
jgi:hypothetical protein